MRSATIILGIALATTALLAVAPAVEAKPYCTHGEGDPCDDPVACVWNSTTGGWSCVRNPGDPRFCDPFWP